MSAGVGHVIVGVAAADNCHSDAWVSPDAVLLLPTTVPWLLTPNAALNVPSTVPRSIIPFACVHANA